MTLRHDPHIAVMVMAAQTAGAKLLERFHNRATLLVEYKNPGDLVSLADRESEETITKILSDAFPDYGILGEEGAAKDTAAHGYRWVIDPLDATNNFLNGIPYWCVTMALEQHGTVMAAVTFDPVHDELFYALRGQGAFLNDRKMATNTKTLLAQAAVATDMGAPPNPLMENFKKVMENSFANCATTLTLRCTALCLASIAAGRLDILTHFGIAKAWDMAAGWLLVEESGGMITDIHTNPLHLESGSLFCAANPTLYNAFSPLLS